MNIRTGLVLPCLVCVVGGCSGGETPSPVTPPGNEKSPRTALLEAGAAALQTQAPIRAINAYLDGFHFYDGDIQGQMEAHHYCSLLNDDVIQCVIYDGNVSDAKLMGLEYIVSDTVFATLPPEEKALWHSHVHEVKSGQLVAPGVPAPAEHALMEKLVRTYGKTWHTWHTDRDKQLPLGEPHLMMGFTQDGQANAAMVEARDQRLRVDSQQKRREREDIPAPAVDSAANRGRAGAN